VSEHAEGADPAATPDEVDLLAIAQNQKTPAEVLEQILDRPTLAPEVVIALLRHPATPGDAMAKLAARADGRVLDVLLGSLDRLGRWVEALEALLENPHLAPVKQPTIREAIAAAKKREADGARRKSLLLQIKDLSVGQRLALAKKGNKDVRMILIRDSNEMVAMETVSSSRITDGEILAIAMMRDVADNVLRYIANNRKYRQNKQIVFALLSNPRTPVGVSLNLGFNNLADRDLTDLSKNRNVPGVISRIAKQILDRRKGAAGPAAGGH
jgi:DNA repair protein RadC